MNASAIAKEKVGRNIPNTPMLGALVKVTGLLDFAKMLSNTEAKLKKKFSHKPEVVAGNILAIKAAYYAVRGE